MFQIHDGNATWIDVWGTMICSALSLVGSLCIILSFFAVRASLQSSPRSARMILNLALSDFVWFLAAFIQSMFWFFTGPIGEVGVPPPGVCWILGPLLNLSRISSLLWTSVIAFEALQAVSKRKWLSDNKSRIKYDAAYFVFVYSFALPSAVQLIYAQHSTKDNVGCRAEYEEIGSMLSIFLTELVPITFGFVLNVFSFLQVKRRMATRAFPRSVRSRRRRVMYHYLGVCTLCWAPTMIHYAYNLIFGSSRFLEVLARCLLYLTGLFNFFVFGINDPHLYRSFTRFIHKITCGYCYKNIDFAAPVSGRQKTVMFENAEKHNADISKDKRTVYRYHRLTKEDKISLYTSRPDLDLKSKAENSPPPRHRRLRETDDAEMNEPLLQKVLIPPTLPCDVSGERDESFNAPLSSPEGVDVEGNSEMLAPSKSPDSQSPDEYLTLDSRSNDHAVRFGPVSVVEGGEIEADGRSSESSQHSDGISIFEPDMEDSSSEEEDQCHNVNDLTASLGQIFNWNFS